MKKILFLLALSLGFVTGNAQQDDPCCAPSRGMMINVPINQNQINGINNSTGDKRFVGNGNVPAQITFNNWGFLLFEGTQTVYPTVNVGSGQFVYVHGYITFAKVTMSGNASLQAESNTEFIIDDFVVNNSGNRLIGYNQSSVFVIKGKRYTPGQTVDGTNIRIEYCNPSLPVVWGNISATSTPEGIKVSWQVMKENANKQFEIEGSTDGNVWRTVATIKSAGNTETGRTYTQTIPNGVTGLLGASMLLCGLLMPFGNKRLKIVSIGLLAIGVLCLTGCSKDNKDVKETNNISFIRIKQVDVNGNVAYSDIVKVHK